jgi:hypothetical protein
MAVAQQATAVASEVRLVAETPGHAADLPLGGGEIAVLTAAEEEEEQGGGEREEPGQRPQRNR